MANQRTADVVSDCAGCVWLFRCLGVHCENCQDAAKIKQLDSDIALLRTRLQENKANIDSLELSKRFVLRCFVFTCVVSLCHLVCVVVCVACSELQRKLDAAELAVRTVEDQRVHENTSLSEEAKSLQARVFIPRVC